MKLNKYKEFLILKHKDKELRYSLKEFKFIDNIKGFCRFNTKNCEFEGDSKVYKEIIDVLSVSGNIVNGLKKLGEDKWVEILFKYGIKINDIKYLIRRRRKGSSLLDFEATTPSKILKINNNLLKLLRKNGESLNWFDIEDFQILNDNNFEILKTLGISDKKDNLIMYFPSDFCQLATNKSKNCNRVSILKVANILVGRLGYNKIKLKNYLDTYMDKNVDKKESLLYLLYSYADWNVFNNRLDYKKYPKDILNSVAKCRIEEDCSDIFVENYKKIYTNRFDVDCLSMPKSYIEFVERAKEMDNCLLNGNKYIWDILTLNKVILFGKRDGKLICCELIQLFDEYIAGDILGVRNSKLNFEEEIRNVVNDSHFKVNV